jgi:transcriptional regulator with XRE-family HTH domain
MASTTGERIKNLLEERQMTHEDLGKILDLDRSTISGWVSDKNPRNPSYELMKKLSVFFNVTCDYLIGVVDEKDQLADVDITLTDGTEVKVLVDMLNTLNESDRNSIITLLKSLYEKDRK